MSLPNHTLLPPHSPPSKRFVSHEGRARLGNILISNYPTWLGGLKLFLKSIGKEYVFTTPLPEITEASPLAEKDAYVDHLYDSFRARKLMMVSMPAEFREMFEDDGVFDIYQKLSKMFSGCLSQHDLDFLDDPNGVECIHCTQWGHLKKNCPEYLQQLKDEESNGLGSTSGINFKTNSLFILVLNKQCD